MPRLSDPLVYALWGLFLLGAIAVLAVLFPAELRFRRKKPEEFQLYQEPPKASLQAGAQRAGATGAAARV